MRDRRIPDDPRHAGGPGDRGAGDEGRRARRDTDLIAAIERHAAHLDAAATPTGIDEVTTPGLAPGSVVLHLQPAPQASAERRPGPFRAVHAPRARRWLVAAAALAIVAATGALAASGGDHAVTRVAGPDEPVGQPRIEVVVATGPARDGEAVQVRGQGFAPDAEVTVTQCLGADGPCDDWRPGVTAVTDVSGRFTTPFLAYHDIGVDRGDAPAPPGPISWTACTPCEVRAEGGNGDAQRTAVVPLPVAPTGSPRHPIIRVVPDAGLRPGDRVRIEGSGFQYDPDGLGTGVAYCPADALRVELCGGGPELGDMGVDETGNFTVDAFELPGPDTEAGGVRCARAPGACVLTWHLYSPGPLPPGLPLDLSG